jgi:hypothetical protein
MLGKVVKCKCPESILRNVTCKNWRENVLLLLLLLSSRKPSLCRKNPMVNFTIGAFANDLNQGPIHMSWPDSQCWFYMFSKFDSHGNHLNVARSRLPELR